MKYKLTLSFDGSAFSGWQVQNNAPTVQAELTRCVRIILGDTATVTGSSRTDSGVHALGFVCHIESEKSLPESSLLSALNHNLDTHIAVLDCVKAPDSFHARYSAVSKEYHYIIHNSEIHDPFLNSRVWHYPYPLDAVKMNESAAELLGEHRFTSFMAAGSKIVDTTRCVYKSEVIRDGKSLVFSVLSPQNQLQLKYFIEDSVRNFGCQFVISTHSPFLLSLRGAHIYNIDETPPAEKKWTELDCVKVYHDFFIEQNDKFH